MPNSVFVLFFFLCLVGAFSHFHKKILFMFQRILFLVWWHAAIGNMFIFKNFPHSTLTLRHFYIFFVLFISLKKLMVIFVGQQKLKKNIYELLAPASCDGDANGERGRHDVDVDRWLRQPATVASTPFWLLPFTYLALSSHLPLPLFLSFLYWFE